MNNNPVILYTSLSAGVTAFSTTRHGGCSQGNYASLNCTPYTGDVLEHVCRNREILCHALPRCPRELVIPFQTHGTASLVNRIVLHTLERMRALYGTDGRNVTAVIGPGISLPAFEVGEEVYEAFREQGFPMEYISEWNPATHKHHIDLWAANRMQLQDFGAFGASGDSRYLYLHPA